MIDKLDLRIPRMASFSRPIREYTRGLPYETYTSRVRPAVHYSGKADLRPLGIDAVLHLHCRHGDKESKLEIMDAGKKPYSQFVQLIESITDADPMTLGIMRIDLTADVRDVTVPWFKSHVRFQFKRKDNEYGQVRYGLIGRGEVETITAGSRPNVFRIYNKTEECLAQFRRMQRRVSKDSDSLSFDKEFGFAESEVRTRIERQCGGSRIPLELETFGHLRNAPDFNPFKPLKIIRSVQAHQPSPDECQGLEYFTGVGLALEADRRGMQGLRKLLNRQSTGNAARVIQKYERFFSGGSEMPISVQRIYEVYRDSTIEQLTA